MFRAPTWTRKISRVSGIYKSVCHSSERTILEGQEFPRCGRCNKETAWIFLRCLTKRERERSDFGQFGASG